jgi:DNA-damage-inducible protein D
MNSESIQELASTFDAHAQQTEGGIEYWLARDLQALLGFDPGLVARVIAGAAAE